MSKEARYNEFFGCKNLSEMSQQVYLMTNEKFSRKITEDFILKNVLGSRSPKFLSNYLTLSSFINDHKDAYVLSYEVMDYIDQNLSSGKFINPFPIPTENEKQNFTQIYFGSNYNKFCLNMNEWLRLREKGQLSCKKMSDNVDYQQNYEKIRWYLNSLPKYQIPSLAYDVFYYWYQHENELEKPVSVLSVRKEQVEITTSTGPQNQVETTLSTVSNSIQRSESDHSHKNSIQNSTTESSMSCDSALDLTKIIPQIETAFMKVCQQSMKEEHDSLKRDIKFMFENTNVSRSKQEKELKEAQIEIQTLQSTNRTLETENQTLRNELKKEQTTTQQFLKSVQEKEHEIVRLTDRIQKLEEELREKDLLLQRKLHSDHLIQTGAVTNSHVEKLLEHVKTYLSNANDALFNVIISRMEHEFSYRAIQHALCVMFFNCGSMQNEQELYQTMKNYMNHHLQLFHSNFQVWGTDEFLNDLFMIVVNVNRTIQMIPQDSPVKIKFFTSASDKPQHGFEVHGGISMGQGNGIKKIMYFGLWPAVMVGEKVNQPGSVLEVKYLS